MFFQFVFILDQRGNKFTTSTKSNKWSKKIFCFLLDIARTNGQTIFSKNKRLDPRSQSSSQFLWNLVLQLVTPHILRRRTTHSYISSSSGIKATTEYFLRITARERNLCQADGVVVPNQMIGGRGGGRGRGGRGGRGGDRQNLFSHSSDCPRTRKCRECLNLIQGDGYDREKRRLSSQAQQCQQCENAVCKNHRKIVCIPCADRLVINENNNDFDFEIE